jgi:hypothetical protein
MEFARATFWISAGPAAWVVHFAALYGIGALACARRFPEAVPWIVVIATVGAAALAASVLVKCLAERADFVRWVGAGNAAIALIAIAWGALPVLKVPACVS